ncbi:MAG TPA: EamA family transporter [Dokdonella sp.]|uniref:aromatic amino acid exporter YddG n=1 Tax=Dokdonella sp. TaxID=2291710 RepID=UPI0025B98C49|nr:EamA family transporter [Dokdonella sp.]MBX3692770.1 EamA family transporter [Dokdonella sp.]MCW5569137.1 EamA family transporter [Dokdonella sp.]HNR91072.1 EamA family transporter [Dokdonella sp.]
MPTSRTRATIGGIVAILLWSSLAVFTLGTASLPPFQVLAIVFLVGGISGLAGNAVDGSGLRALRQPWPGFLLSAVGLFGYHALYFIAFRHAPAIEANLVNYLWPLLIVVFAAFVPGVGLRVGQLVGTLVALAGVVVMLTRGRALEMDPAHVRGYAAAAMAALTWAAYSVSNRRFAEVPSAAIAGPCLVVSMLAAIVHLASERTVAPGALQWVVLVLMGIGPTGIAFRLWDGGTKRGDLALLGTLSYAAPVLSTGFLLASGRVDAHPTQAIALALLLLGAWISVRASRAR